ncbi:MAG: hypothetical protein AAF226_09860, partial [Verrucomicrobiota bacterium]
IPADTVCTEVTATIDILPTLAGICGAQLPESEIDGHDIAALIKGDAGAKSPHQYYTLMHQKGAVRSGPWKYYPWPDGTDKRSNSAERKPSEGPVQLYHVLDDINESNNVASEHPEKVKELQAAFEAHVEKINANLRPTSTMVRPEGVVNADRPGLPNSKAAAPINWKKAKPGDSYPAKRAPQVASKGFSISAKVGDSPAEGVLISHGGAVIGYSLYLTNQSTAVFVLRHGSGEASVHRVEAPLQKGKNHIVCQLDKEGTMSLVINDGTPVSQKSQLLEKHPAEALNIGYDEAKPVDKNAPTSPFRGELEKIEVLVK